MEYLYWKVGHIIAFTSWMAMLFYMPRLFVYHAEHRDNTGFVEVVKIQESKLYYFIGYVALIATIITGVFLIMSNPIIMKNAFMHIKMLLVILLIAYHFSLGYFMKQFARNQCNKSGKFFRIYNEVPTVIFIAIVVLIIIQPSF